MEFQARKMSCSLQGIRNILVILILCTSTWLVILYTLIGRTTRVIAISEAGNLIEAKTDKSLHQDFQKLERSKAGMSRDVQRLEGIQFGIPTDVQTPEAIKTGMPKDVQRLNGIQPDKLNDVQTPELLKTGSLQDVQNLERVERLGTGTPQDVQTEKFEHLDVYESQSNDIGTTVISWYEPVKSTLGPTPTPQSTKIETILELNNATTPPTINTRDQTFNDTILLHQDFWNVENNFSFRYVLDPEQVCQKRDSGSSDDPILLITILAAVKHAKKRDAIRHFLRYYNVAGVSVRWVFLLGLTRTKKDKSELRREFTKNGDVVMANFIDTYKNLTLKVLSGMNWVATRCQDHKHVFLYKIDDDMFSEKRLQYGVNALLKHKKGVIVQKHTAIWCALMSARGAPVRTKRYKWSLSVHQDPESRHPKFCKGSGGYFLSRETAARLYEMSLHTHFVWLEDVYITGILRHRLRDVMARSLHFPSAGL